VNDGGACALLAQSEQGHVKMCAVGCTHLTYGRVSLHFGSLDEFEGFAEEFLSEAKLRTAYEGVNVNYQWLSISLSAHSAKAFAALLEEAIATVRWFRGDLSLTEADVQEMMKGRLL